jgi:hypothetical protein
MWAKFPGLGHHLLSADLRQMQECCEEETAAMDREFQYSSTRGADWSCFRMVPGQMGCTWRDFRTWVLPSLNIVKMN